MSGAARLNGASRRRRPPLFFLERRSVKHLRDLAVIAALAFAAWFLLIGLVVAVMKLGGIW